jgi:N-acetylglucosamine kinase-like BadF-type ATPase
MSKLLLSVDGGGTKTVALIARWDGEILGYGRDGSSDIHGDPDPEVPSASVSPPLAQRSSRQVASSGRAATPL